MKIESQNKYKVDLLDYLFLILFKLDEIDKKLAIRIKNKRF